MLDLTGVTTLYLGEFNFRLFTVSAKASFQYTGTSSQQVIGH